MFRLSTPLTRNLVAIKPSRLGQFKLSTASPTVTKLHTPREHIDYLQQLAGKSNTLILYEQLKPRRGITIFSIFFALTMLVQAGVLAEWSIGAAYDMWNNEAVTRDIVKHGGEVITESSEEKEKYFNTIPLSSPQSIVSFGGRVLVALTITGIPLFFALKAIQFPQNLVKRVTLIPRGVRSQTHCELQVEKSSIWDQLRPGHSNKVSSRNTHYLPLEGELELTRGSVVHTGKGENLAQAESGLPFFFALKKDSSKSDKETKNNGFLMNLVRGTPFIFDRNATFWGTPIIWDKLFASSIPLKKKVDEAKALATAAAEGTPASQHMVSTDISQSHLRARSSARDITSAVNAALEKKNKKKNKKN